MLWRILIEDRIPSASGRLDDGEGARRGLDEPRGRCSSKGGGLLEKKGGVQ